MTSELLVVIPGEPVAQGRPRFARRGPHVVAYDPARSRNWKAYARDVMARAMAADGWTISDAPLSVGIAATFTCPRSHARKRSPRPRRWHAKRPDIENVAKGVLDAATGVVWTDDDQVAQLLVVKTIAAQDRLPSVLLRVSVLDWAPTDHWGR